MSHAQAWCVCCLGGWPTGLSEQQGVWLQVGCGVSESPRNLNFSVSAALALVNLGSCRGLEDRWPGIFQFYRLLQGLNSQKKQPQGCHPGPEDPLCLLD